MLWNLIAPTIAVLATVPALAADVHVVDPAGGAGVYTTIQAAVDTALDGDIVLVRAGVYPETVVLDGRALALFGEGMPRIDRGFRIRNLAPGETVLLAGFEVSVPGFSVPYRGAVDVRACQGPVRIQDCTLRGGDALGTSPYFAPPVAFIVESGGPGLLVDDASDVSLDAVIVSGGNGATGFIGIGAAGLGGDAVVANDTARLSLARITATGGRGGGLDDPGHGGAGVRMVGTSTLHVTASVLVGGTAGCWGQVYSTSGWRANGGPGLELEATAAAWTYGATLVGGDAAVGSCSTPAGSSPGSPSAGAGVAHPLSGTPHALDVPRVVREGQPWQIEVVSLPGHVVQLRYTAGTGVRFSSRLGHPYLLGPQPAPFFSGPLAVGTNGRAVLQLPAFQLPGGVDGLVFWLQANVGPAARGSLANARAVLLLDAAF